MAETLYTIPINEAFAQKDGCPLCRLTKKLEEDSLEYVMGAAMMEPDVRQTTNRLGFCRKHFDSMLGMKNRLSLGLMLESHLDTVSALFADPEEKTRKSRLKKYSGPTPAAEAGRMSKSCFVCSRVAGFEEKYLDNTVHLWKKDPAFRELFSRQPCFCLGHYAGLLDQAQAQLSEDGFSAFSETLTGLMRRYGQALRQEVTGFCQSFDYDKGKTPLTPEQRTAVVRSADWLAGE